jgi:hypothetical protein
MKSCNREERKNWNYYKKIHVLSCMIVWEQEGEEEREREKERVRRGKKEYNHFIILRNTIKWL